jgi:hypothetical protein
MKTYKRYLIIILTVSSQTLFGQIWDPSIAQFLTLKRSHPERENEYKDIEGSPYLNYEFADGVFYLKDTIAVKLPIRYNIFADEMEYQFKGSNYVVGNPLALNKVKLGESVYVYLKFIQKGGYFELFELGKCTLVQKKLIKFYPAEDPKPIVAPTGVPAKFNRESDVYYFVVHDSLVHNIENMKSVTNALQDQKLKIENFIKDEKIKNIKKENLIKIVKYYNSL